MDISFCAFALLPLCCMLNLRQYVKTAILKCDFDFMEKVTGKQIWLSRAGRNWHRFAWPDSSGHKWKTNGLRTPRDIEVELDTFSFTQRDKFTLHNQWMSNKMTSTTLVSWYTVVWETWAFQLKTAEWKSIFAVCTHLRSMTKSQSTQNKWSWWDFQEGL